MNHDAVMSSMLWVGALFVFTPIVVVGAVILAIRRQRRQDPDAGPPPG